MSTTPGPWHVVICTNDSEPNVSRYAINAADETDEQAVYNAALIAAAPELRDALREATEELQFIATQALTARNLAPLVERLHNVLAKAEGKKS